MSKGEITGQIFATPVAEERRETARKATVKSGEIVYKHTYCIMSCVVLDLSEDGARMKPEDPLACPEVFLLRIKHGACLVCQAIWREKGEVGVKFIAELD